MSTWPISPRPETLERPDGRTSFLVINSRFERLHLITSALPLVLRILPSERESRGAPARSRPRVVVPRRPIRTVVQLFHGVFESFRQRLLTFRSATREAASMKAGALLASSSATHS